MSAIIVPERILELANRLVAVGTKCCQVSASECHEITDYISSLNNDTTKNPQKEKATIDEGGPAFPAYTYDHTLEGQVVRATDYGMTLRDYFAAKAMPGVCANPQDDLSASSVASLAYTIADAMLAERNKQP